jgi:methylmalonyl-CoA mutase
VAKLRAARLLWSAIVTAYDPKAVEQAKMNIHCVTSRWNKTLYDPYMNLLRTQTEAMSSVLGGTDSLTVEPFDTVFRPHNDFSERVARNQQLILKEEVHLDVTSDPAAGSYFIEKITALLAEQAWKIFIDTEEKGGFIKALQSGFIQTSVKDIADARLKDFALRKEILVGTNQYPDNSGRESGLYDSEIYYRKKSATDVEIEPLHITRAAAA